jgi:hypothetical protein
MLAGESLPEWVSHYAKIFDGLATPSKSVIPLGSKTHDCGGNELYVLFAPGGKLAWGLLSNGGEESWLGYPDAAIQAAIKSGAQ